MQVKEIEVGKFYEVLYGRMYRNVLVLEKDSNRILCYDFVRRNYRTFLIKEIGASIEILSEWQRATMLQAYQNRATKDNRNANRR